MAVETDDPTATLALLARREEPPITCSSKATAAKYSAAGWLWVHARYALTV
jgi:hypothetical protein